MIKIRDKPTLDIVRPSVSDAASIRGRLIHAAEQNVAQGLVGFLVAATLTMLLFYDRWHPLILVWYIIVLVVCISRIVSARQITRHDPVPMSAGAIYKYIGWTVITAAATTSFPAWVTMEAGGFSFAFMIVLFIGTFWSASFVHAPVLPTSIAFMLTQLLVAIMAGMLAGIDELRTGLIWLYVVGTGSGFHIIRQHSALFRQAIHQQFELEKKNETISLLLKEYENQSSDWLWQIDASLKIVAPSSRFADAFSQTSATLTGLRLIELLGGQQDAGQSKNSLTELETYFNGRRAFRDTIVPMTIDSRAVWLSLSGRPTQDDEGRFTGYRGVMVDITEARSAQERAIHLTYYDALTDLPNRTQFTSLLQRAFSQQRSFSLLSIDLDDFKEINKLEVNSIGDRTLVEIARRLQENVDAKDIVARLGNDEFIVQTWRLAPEDVAALCHRLIEAVSRVFEIDDAEVIVGASMGVAFAPSDGQTTETILQSADSALYRAKMDGGGTFRFFSPEMDHQLQVRQQLLQDLRKALADDRLTLHYQPLFDAQSGVVTGCEALIRWRHNEQGAISPAIFIPIAEESSLIVPIGSWVIEQACREAASWPSACRVSVNVSPMQFTRSGLDEQVRAALDKTGLAPHRLELEVTETVLMKDSETALDTLRRIRALRVRVALDDFGTGYSSLSYLRDFPFDRIKIDRAFVQDLETSQESKVIIQAILDIATALGMKITAEGIETDEQATYLKQIGCHEFQGFLFAKPAPPGDIAAVINAHGQSGQWWV